MSIRTNVNNLNKSIMYGNASKSKNSENNLDNTHVNTDVLNDVMKERTKYRTETTGNTSIPENFALNSSTDDYKNVLGQNNYTAADVNNLIMGGRKDKTNDGTSSSQSLEVYTLGKNSNSNMYGNGSSSSYSAKIGNIRPQYGNSSNSNTKYNASIGNIRPVKSSVVIEEDEDLPWYKKLAENFSMFGECIGETCTGYWDSAYNTVTNNGTETSALEIAENTLATISNASYSAIEGIGKLGEKLVDTNMIVRSGMKTLYYMAKDGITGSDSSEEVVKLWDNTMDTVAVDFVGDAFDEFYENTDAGKWIKENSYGFDTVRTVSSGIGEVVGIVALSVATGGTATPALMATWAGAAGFGKGAEIAWQNGASLEQGLTAATLNGSWEALQFYVGGKINTLSPFTKTGANIALRVGLDTVDGGVEGFVQPLISATYQNSYYDEELGEYVKFSNDATIIDKYKEMWDDQGGWKQVGEQAAVGMIMSSVSEGFEYHTRKGKLGSSLDSIDERLAKNPSAKLSKAELANLETARKQLGLSDKATAKEITDEVNKLYKNLDYDHVNLKDMDLSTLKKLSESVDGLDPKVQKELLNGITGAKELDNIKNVGQLDYSMNKFITSLSSDELMKLNSSTKSTLKNYMSDKLKKSGYDVSDFDLVEIQKKYKQNEIMNDTIESSNRRASMSAIDDAVTLEDPLGDLPTLEDPLNQKTTKTIANDVTAPIPKIDTFQDYTNLVHSANYSKMIDGIIFISETDSGLNSLVNYYTSVKNRNNTSSNYFLEVLGKKNLVITDIPSKVGERSFCWGEIIYFDQDVIKNNRHSTFFHECGHFLDNDSKNKHKQSFNGLINYLKNNYDNLDLRRKGELLKNDINVFKKRINDELDMNYSRDITNLHEKLWYEMNGYSTSTTTDQRKVLDYFYNEFRKNKINKSLSERGFYAVSDIYDAITNGEFYKDGFVGHGSTYYSGIDNCYKETLANVSDLYNSGNMDILDIYLPTDVRKNLTYYYEDLIGVIELKNTMDAASLIHDQKYGKGSFAYSLLEYLNTGDSSIFTRQNNIRSTIELLSSSSIKRYLTSYEVLEDYLNYSAIKMDSKYGAGVFRKQLEKYLETGSATYLTRDGHVREYVSLLDMSQIKFYLNGNL